MKVTIDLEKCYRSGECYYNHPELFEMDEEGKPLIRVRDITSDLGLHAEQAAEVCPSAAITVARD
jgi:ferredoxin